MIATILAKNEEDIIGKMIEHHVEQGISKFILTDNNSSDKTKQIAEKYPEVVEIIDEPGETHNQSEWVTRMARIACKFHPDWIVHLDADELWCGLSNLRKINGQIASCERMFLHPPVKSEEFDILKCRYYLNFDKMPIPQECKVAHRPDLNFVIQHGNHGIEGQTGQYTNDVFRHHYPIRTLKQWERKANGHLALQRRNSYCERWGTWYNLAQTGKMNENFDFLCENWLSYRSDKIQESFTNMLGFWATSEMIKYFKKSNMLPEIGEWPK